MSDVCSRLFIIIKSHDLHIVGIRKAMGEIASDHERDQLSLSFWFLWIMCLLAFFLPSFFVSPMMVLAINLLLDFCLFHVLLKM